MALQSPGQFLKSLLKGSLELIPPEFRALFGVEVDSQKVPLDATLTPLTNPLDPSAPAVVEARLDQEKINERTQTTTSLISPDGTLDTGYQLPNGLIANDVRGLVSSPTAPSANFLTIQSTEHNLGNGLIDETSTTTPNFPDQQGQLYDEAYDWIVPFNQYTKPYGQYIGTATTSVDPEDYLRNRVRQFTIPTAALASFFRVFPGTANIEVPPTLTSIDIVAAKSSSTGSGVAAGATTSSGTNWSIQLSLPNSSEASATVSPEILPRIKYAWGKDKPVIDLFFFAPSGVSQADILTRATTILGQTVNAWPDFQPEEAVFLGQSQKLSVRAATHVDVYASGWANDTSAGSSSGYVAGVETSVVLDDNNRVYTIPPTLHGSVTLNFNETQDFVVGSSTTITGTVSASAVAPGTLQVATGLVSATISATSPTAVPSSGLYLLKVDCDNFRWGYVSIRARIFDFSTL